MVRDAIIQILDDPFHQGGVVGKYVADYTPHGNGGMGMLVLTDNPAEAKSYASPAEGMIAWKEPSKTHPLRADGKPNRPLSAYTITVIYRSAA